MSQRIIGITGCIGSGKTTISNLLKSHFGAYIIDADKIARTILDKDLQVKKNVVEYFTKAGVQNVKATILYPNGAINRSALSKLIFTTHKELKPGFESLVHAEIAKEIYKIVKIHNNENLIVLDVPIPLQRGFFDIIKEVWIVTCNINIRKARIMNRNVNWAKSEIQARMKSQLTQKEYIQLCKGSGLVCHKIINNGDIAKLKEQIQKILEV